MSGSPNLTPQTTTGGPAAAWIDAQSMRLGTALMDILMAEDIQPGSAPSYELCKLLYLYHTLGAKMAESPVTIAMSQKREIVVPGAPEMVKDAFNDEWERFGADQNIAQTATLARVYGIASLVLGAEDFPADQPIPPEKLSELRLFLNVADPLNTSGSLVLNQDPNSPAFQKHVSVSVAGTVYHRSRACVLMNERPIFISFTNSAFGFVGRSVYQRALYPLKTFIQTMITDDTVSMKAGLLVAKMKSPGSTIDRAMQLVQGVKRTLLKIARTGNVLSIGHEDSIETLNMMNLDGAAGFARTNVLKNIATAADMPAVMLENETLTHGFGEGSEDAKIIARYIETRRAWMAPVYGFMDGIIQRRAWNPKFYELVQRQFPELYADRSYDSVYYEWENAFKATWPSLLIEPESELVKVEDVKLKSLIAAVQVLIPEADPINKSNIFQFFEDNINESKLLFPNPLRIDYDALEEFQTEKVEQMQQQQEDKELGAEPPRPFASRA